MDEPQLRDILADLEADGVHVDEAAEQWISPADVEALEAAVAAAPEPVFVVLVPPPDDASSSWGDDLAFRLHQQSGVDGLYLGVDGVYDDFVVRTEGGVTVKPHAGGDSFQMSVQQWGEVAGSDDVTFEVGSVLDHGDAGAAYPLGTGLVEVTSAIADGTLSEVAAQASADWREVYEAESSDATGIVLGVLGALGAAGVGYAVRRARRRRSGSDAFVLPASVLEKVREAGDVDAVRRSRSAVLALGERIDATDLPSAAGTHALASWQAALDHYDAATRLLPERGDGEQVDVLDAVGALVLARRGEVALDAARRGAAFHPPRPCFLNPLHDEAVDPRPLELDGRRVEAPVCRGCRRDLEAGRRPDILDVRAGGGAAHYFETDREPWASTGFGALDDDLLTRLQGSTR